MTIVPFEVQYLPQVIEMTSQYWKKDYEGQSEAFIRIVSELIVRKNYYDNQSALMFMQANEVRGILFSYKKGDQSDAAAWLGHRKIGMPQENLDIINNLTDYLYRYDNLMDSYITNEDRKVSLFISDFKGAGTALLNHYINQCQEQGVKQIFLWTDSSCNHDYYPNRGFELFFTEDNASKASTDANFTTMFYKKKL